MSGVSRKILGASFSSLENVARKPGLKSTFSGTEGRRILRHISKEDGLARGSLSSTAQEFLFLTPVRYVHSAATRSVNISNNSSRALAQIEAHPEETDGYKLLWRGDRSTHLFQAANLHGTRNGLAVVTLNSARPLCYDKVKEAFTILQRKALNLRTCLKPYGDDLWICELPNAEVDFKVLDENIDCMKAAEESVIQGFKSHDSPHWRVRLIPRSMDSPCVLPEVKANFPYQYDYIFHPNHVMCDGINVAMFIQFSLNILNGIIEGHSIEENQIGEYTNDDGLKEIEAQIEELMLSDPNYLAKVSSQLPPPNKPLLLAQVFPQPEGREKPFSKHISRMIDTQILYSINKKSKATGITFNSSFAAVINTAIVDLLKESGHYQDSYQISTNHIVNIRRYLQKNTTPIFGSYNYPLSHSSHVSAYVKENFWDYAKSLHQDLNLRLKSREVFEQNVYRKLTQSKVDPSAFFLNPPPVVHDYGVSNVGDITSFVPGTGKHVQISDMVPYNYIHSFIHTNLHQTVTYRGRSRYTLSFDTNYMEEDSASKLADRVVSLLADFGN